MIGKGGWLARLKEGLARTRVNLVGLFSGGVIDEALFEELEIALLQADVGVAATTELLQKLRSRIKLQGLKAAPQVRDALREEIATLLSACERPLDLQRPRPLILMVAGVNGAGKTTSIGKLAYWLSQQGKSVLLAAGDTFRAAAREQLAVWGERNGVQVIAQQSGDPAAVIFDAVAAARARSVDVLIADTAGRLPTQLHLMDELKRVKRAIDKALPGAPQEVILVLDGTNGQNVLAQVAAFDAAIGLTGLIVTKLDGTAKGGVLVALARARLPALPVYFIGVGEQLEDLQPFAARDFAAALLGD
ncbi:MAG: signal recognition particle-docking protein FtsY [Sutterellaceae bacterium]|nr:signal recognition particle-docking protein FtsY [Burkholderiaceae bacterium]MCX7901824.1 signal recognition particle-docking protein FtsY [Burkholderiaceae bacterium]MDW8430628.1 signal recognition particle-docking protein FtsY [Sutterellaceae bacterium]